MSLKDRAQKVLDNRGYIPPENREYILRDNDGNVFGNVSYSAAKAVNANALDRYKPKNDSERDALEKYKNYVAQMQQAQEESDLSRRAENEKREKLRTMIENNPNLTEEQKQKNYARLDELAKPAGIKPETAYHRVNSVESYSKNDSVKSLEQWLGTNAKAGGWQILNGINSTVDFFLPTEFLGKYDFISKIANNTKAFSNAATNRAHLSGELRGRGWKTGGDILAGSVAALPNAILAYMTAGTSLPAQGASLATGATLASQEVTLGGSATQQFGQLMSTMAKNPMYWSSFAQTVGTDYEDAKENGANELVATTSALLTSAINAGIEIGGGIETLPDNVKKGNKNAVVEWVKSMANEGKEEVLQGIVSQSMAKLLYDPKKPVFSLTDENAVLNPYRSAQEFAMGAAVGGVLGGAQLGGMSAVNYATNSLPLKKTGKYFSQDGAIDALIETGLESPTGTQSRTQAEKLKKLKDNGKKIPYIEIGKLYNENVRQLFAENAKAQEINAGDMFYAKSNGNTIKVLSVSGDNAEIRVNNNTKSSVVPISAIRQNIENNNFQKQGSVENVSTVEQNSTAAENASAEHTPEMQNDTNYAEVGVLGTVEGTLKSDILQPLKAVEQQAPGTMKNFATEIAAEYQENGSIGEYAKYFADGGEAVTAALANSDVNGNGDIKFSIETIAGTDKQYVKADRQVITGDDPKAWGKQVFDYINNTIRNGKDLNVIGADGDILTITSDTAGKATFRNDVRMPDGTHRQMTDAEYAAKLRAESHIDEIAQVSKDSGDAALDTKNHSFAKDGFQYRTAYFEDADGQYYRLTISIGKNGEINTVYNIGKIKETTSPVRGSKAARNSSDMTGGSFSKETSNTARGSKAAGNSSDTADRGFSNNPTIPQKESGVNTYNTQNTIKNSMEDNTNGRGDLYSNRDGGRQAGENTAEQAGRLAEGSGSYQAGRATAAERSVQTQNARDNGQIVQTAVAQWVRADVIQPKAYTPEMQALVDFNKSKYGVDTILFSGNAQVAFHGNIKYLRGFRLSDGTIGVQYDNELYLPEQISKHEAAHNQSKTAEYEKVSKYIKNSLSVAEQEHIIYDLYERYYEIADGNEDYVWEEFICDVLAGMSEYSARYEDVINEFWNAEEVLAEVYNPATYAASLDAGGVKPVSEQIREWNQSGRNPRTTFDFGVPSKALQEAGITNNNKIQMDASKVLKILKAHSDITLETLAGVEDILNNPILILKSRTQPDSVVVYGELHSERGIPVMAALRINLKSGINSLETVNKITSVYARNNTQYLLDNSDILWVEPDKKRTNQWLSAYRLQLPSASTTVGSSDVSIAQSNTDVNTNIRGNGGNDTGGDVFTVPLSVSQKFAAQVDSWLNRTLPSSGLLQLGSTPEVLKQLGANDLPVVMNQDILVKITGGKHNISLDEIKNLPQAITDPIMVFKSATVPNSFVILTELVDKSGNDVVAALHLNRSEGFNQVNRIASVYGKNNAVNFVQAQIKAGNLKYIDKNKSSEWLRSRGLQLPKLNTIQNSNNSILQKEDIVNTNIRENGENDTDGIRFSVEDKTNNNPDIKEMSVEAQELLHNLTAKMGWTETKWEQFIKEYGAIPKGENPVRDIQIPKKIAENRVVSRFARTAMEAGVTPDFAISEFERRILDGTMTHEVIGNKKAGAHAVDKIKKLGFQEALRDWEAKARDGKINKYDIAFGQELYNQCITNKDVTNAMKIMADLVAEGTRNGQNLQAARMLKLATPDGQLYYIEKSVQKMNEEFKEKLGDKFKNITLDEKLMEKFLLEKDEKKRAAAYDEICQSIADQIPATLLDKWDAWRYLAMLGNPRTHIRNILGNAAFVPALRMKNYIGAVLERTTRVDTSERTKSIKKDKKAVAFAKADFEEMASVLQGENAKYAVTSDIEGKRRIFKTKWLEKLRTKNFDFLEAEDLWFLKLHYIDALARIITARNLDVNTIDERTLDTVRAYAIKEAQAATYRDANALAESLNKIQRKFERSDNKAVRAAGTLVEGVMPFKKTPLNIAKQGVMYSPMGILSGIYKIAAKVRGGTIYSTTEIIDTMAKGLTGTGIMLLGLLLSSLGFLVGGDDEDKKKRSFDKLTGEQSYALKFGNKTYTIDWAVPLSLPLFIGVELDKMTKSSGYSVAQVTNAISTLAEPLLELSVFSGINDTIQAAQYNDTNAIAAVLYDAASSYVMQAFPTVFGQMARMIDKNKRNYYYNDKDSKLPKFVQSFIGQAAAKIPFASYLFEHSVDDWGRDESYGNIFERVVENTISPGYYSETEYTAVDGELKRLYEQTGDSDVFPKMQQKYFTEKNVRYNLSASEYAETKRLRGQESFRLVKKLISSGKYKSMSDEKKVKAISQCYTEAGRYAKEKMLDKVRKKKKGGAEHN